ncbi:amidase family protein [Paraburkholderia agricolaris]|uniref:amidase family protein n=1 Tax=Paraburkholderia agricolaris TaxID=2152888 RepID=UPI0038B70705
MTLTETALLLEQGETDAVTLVEDALRRARESEHVFTSLFAEAALEEARAAALRRRRGNAMGPLDGIPVAVKDLFDVKDSRTLAGSVTREKVAPATADAPLILALRRQGLIPLGKTTLSEFAFSGLGLNPHFGTPVPDFPGTAPRIPGGSSAGSAVAVQRGIVAGALGTDTGGSIRVPAAFNGLAGFKSSSSRYDMRGVHALAPTLDSLGPIAHTVHDCAMLDAAMRGLRQTTRAAALHKVRFVVDATTLQDPDLQPEIRGNLMEVMETLRAAGASVEIRTVDAIEQVRRVIAAWGWLGAVEAWTGLRKIVEGPDGGRIDRRIHARLIAASRIDENAVNAIKAARYELMPAIRRELDGAVLVLPTVKHVAPLLDPIERDDDAFAKANAATLSITMLGSFLDMPGIAMRSGTGEAGLPTSVLFSMSRGNDDAVLNVGLAIEAELAAALAGGEEGRLVR